MEREDNGITTSGRDAGAVHHGSASSRRIPLLLRIAIVVLLVVPGLGLLFDLGTASPRVCLSCHEMELRAESWGESPHGVVACVKCHQAPTRWYELPQRVAGRARLLGRDVAAHFSGDFQDPVDAAVSGGTPVIDDVCLQCHDPNRKATSGFRILIDHVEHAKRNGQCVSCHVRTAHPAEGRGTAMSLMSQCYTCHGTAEQPTASAECGVCHPADYELLPGSHTEEQWARGHGDASQADTEQCRMCHAQSFCSDCHGLPMPHPESWAAGSDGHAVVAESDPEVCSRCHGTSPDLCSMCHHTSFDPMEGTWVDQHDLEVRQEGSEYCMRCHPGPYCSYCHTALVERDGL